MQAEQPPDDLKTADARWQAVVERDHRADGQFVYAVKTTRIFCRPGCPSKIAKRQNIEFFDTADLAAAAGFRPCKRCQPDNMSPQQKRLELVISACKTIAQTTSAISLDSLARQAGLSRYHFHRIFKGITGLTPMAYYRAIQTGRTAAALSSASSVTEAIYDAGFNSAGRFYDNVGATIGMSPSRYRKGAEGEHIRFAVKPCSLGLIIVAATDKGICTIEFGDEAQTLIDRLHDRFPKAQFAPADTTFNRWISEILTYLDRPQGTLKLPLDIQGTIFQRRVWQVLQSIPAGQTVSYTELATRIGQPRAFRAVAHACASNNIAAAIPCHRVIGKNGDLSGYRWGITRKAELLRREKKS